MLLAIAKLQDLDKLSGNGFVRGLRRWLAGFANGYISVVRGTPAVVQLMVIYFIVFSRIFQNSPFEDYQIAALAFGINSGAYVAEIIRAGILAVDRGQTEASRSLGLSSGKTMLYIVIPQAVKNVLPALGNDLSRCSRKPRWRLHRHHGFDQGRSSPSARQLCISCRCFVPPISIS